MLTRWNLSLANHTDANLTHNNNTRSLSLHLIYSQHTMVDHTTIGRWISVSNFIFAHFRWRKTFRVHRTRNTLWISFRLSSGPEWFGRQKTKKLVVRIKKKLHPNEWNTFSLCSARKTGRLHPIVCCKHNWYLFSRDLRSKWPKRWVRLRPAAAWTLVQLNFRAWNAVSVINETDLTILCSYFFNQRLLLSVVVFSFFVFSLFSSLDRPNRDCIWRDCFLFGWNRRRWWKTGKNSWNQTERLKQFK